MNDQASTMMNQNQHQHQPQMMSMNQQQMMLNQPTQSVINRSYGIWAPPLPPVPTMDQLKFQNPNPKMMGPPPPGGLGSGGFVTGKQPQPQHLRMKLLGPRSNWKGKKVNDKRKEGRKKEGIGMAAMVGMAGAGSGVVGGIGGGVGSGGYKPPMLKDLQYQNRMKARRFFTSKKFNHNYYSNNGGNNMGKFAPRNTSSFIIRAKKSGGIAELVSPAQVTPAVLPTPIFSPSREVLVDMAKEEWGVDGYGSMKGLIRLRSPGRDDELHEGDEEEEEGGSSESDVEEHVEVERRLDHDLSRFEMIYPSYAGGVEYNNVLENRVDDQDTHIAQLEEENLILKERLFLMESELGDLRRRLHCLERRSHGGSEEIHEEMVENESENDSESRGEAHSMEDNNDVSFGDNTDVYRDVNQIEEETRDVDEIGKVTLNDKDTVDAEGKGEKSDGDFEVKSENLGVDVDVEGEKEEGAFELRSENLGVDVEIRGDNNEQEVGKEESKD